MKQPCLSSLAQSHICAHGCTMTCGKQQDTVISLAQLLFANISGKLLQMYRHTPSLTGTDNTNG